MKQSVYTPLNRVLLGLLCLVLFSPLQAAPLGLTQGNPDSNDDGTTVANVYDAIGGTSTMTYGDANIWNADGSIDFGNAQYDLFGFNLDGSGDETYYGDLNITASFLNGVLTGGTITIDIAPGTFTPDNNGISSLESKLGLAAGSTAGGNLVTGTLTDFGFSGTDNVGTLEFLFDITGGYYASFFNIGGFALDITGGTGPSGLWTTASVLQADWNGSGKSHTFVPVPAAIWLFASGLLGLASIARRNRK